MATLARVVGVVLFGALSIWPVSSQAQRVVGCFQNGRQVADSMCTGGGGGGRGGGAYTGGGLFYSLGGAMMQALMNAMTPPPGSVVSEAELSVRINNEGVALSRQGRRGEAIEKYKQAVDIDRSNVVAHANYFLEMAQLDSEQGNLQGALFEARRAVEISNTSAEGQRVTLPVALRSVQFIETVLGQRAAAQQQRQATFQADQQALAAKLKPLDAPGGGQSAFGDMRGLRDAPNDPRSKQPPANAGSPSGTGGNTAFFGQPVTTNPELGSAPSGRAGSGPGAYNQAVSARDGAQPGATFDGSRGTAPGGDGLKFVKAPDRPMEPRIWNDADRAKLARTERGRQIIGEAERKSGELQKVEAAYQQLGQQYNSASDEQKTELLNKGVDLSKRMDAIKANLGDLQNEAKKIIVSLD